MWITGKEILKAIPSKHKNNMLGWLHKKYDGRKTLMRDESRVAPITGYHLEDILRISEETKYHQRYKNKPTFMYYVKPYLETLLEKKNESKANN